MKNNEKLISLALVSVIILGIVYATFKPSYERVDVISKDNFSFKLQKILPNENLVGQAYVYSKKSNLAINNIPENMVIACNNRGSFTIDIENKDSNIAKNVNFSIEDAENLKFEYPNEFIIPPYSSRSMTIFIDADCQNAPKSINPTFKIKGTELEFTFSINVENRAE